jgi:hypothetical protein
VAVASDSLAIHVTIDATAVMKVGIDAGLPDRLHRDRQKPCRNDMSFVSPVNLWIRIAFNPNAMPDA